MQDKLVLLTLLLSLERQINSIHYDAAVAQNGTAIQSIQPISTVIENDEMESQLFGQVSADVMDIYAKRIRYICVTTTEG